MNDLKSKVSGFRKLLLIDYQALKAHCSKDKRKDCWTKTQHVNGVEVLTSALASMCLADDDLVGSQLALAHL